MQNYGSTFSTDSYFGREGMDSGTITPHSLLGDNMADGLLGSASGSNMSTTQWLAKQHGVKNERTMYVASFLPNTIVQSSKPAFQVSAILSPRDQLDPPISLELFAW